MEAHTETAHRARPAPRAIPQPQRPTRNTSEVWALVPLKDLSLCKTRLAGVLDAEARRGLALAMARDVTRALTRAGSVARVVMVSDIPGLPGLLGLDDASCGVICFDTGGARGLNEDLCRAAEWAQAQGAGQALIVHADLPHLTAAGIDRFIAAASAPHRLQAAANKEGSGTNLLLAPLPLPLPLVFGSRSLARFHHAAMEAGIDLEVRHDPALAGDIDEAEDLDWLMATYRRGYLAGRATAAWLAATLGARA